MSNLWKNMIWTGILQLVNLLFPLIMLPLMYNYMAIDDYGRMLAILSIAGFTVMLSDAGLTIPAVRKLARCRSSSTVFSVYFSQYVYLKILISTLLGAIITFVFVRAVGDLNFVSFVLIIFLIVAQSVTPYVIFQSLEVNKKLAKIVLLSKMFFVLPLGWILLSVYGSVGAIIFAYLVGNVFVLVCSYYSFFSLGYRLTRAKFYLAWLMFIKSKGYFFSRMAVASYTKGNTALVSILLGPEASALFGTADKIYTAMRSVYMPVSNALYPYISNSQNFKLFKVPFIAVSVFNIVAVIGSWLTLSLLSERFALIEISISIIPYFLVALLFVVPSILIGYPLLGAAGYGNLVNKSTYWGAITYYITLSFWFFFINQSLQGFLLAIIFTEIFVLFYRIFNCRRLKLL